MLKKYDNKESKNDNSVKHVQGELTPIDESCNEDNLIETCITTKPLSKYIQKTIKKAQAH